MTYYKKCNHNSDGLIILDDNILSMSAYLDWAYDEGVFGKEEVCWTCYCNKDRKIT